MYTGVHSDVAQERGLWLELTSARQRALLHISCNIGTHDFPDMYALEPQAQGLRAYISGKSLVPMLQLLHK